MLTTWLTRIGSWMHQERPEGSASKREFLEVLGPLWAKLDGTEWRPEVLHVADPLDSTAGRGIQDFLEKTDLHTGLLVERAPGRYGFPHLTFEEYYAGRALAFEGLSAGRAAGIRRHLHDPRYEEPILLALGLVGREQPEEVERLVAEAIFGSVETPAEYEHLLGRDFLFALRILADDIPLATGSIDGLLRAALDEWFAESGRCRFAAYRTALKDTLSNLGSTKAAPRLAVAVDAIARTAASAGPQRFSDLAVAIAKVGPLPAEVISALVGIITGEGDPSVRASAAQALALAGPLPAEVISALVGIITGEGDPSVRASAAQALALAGPLAAEVFSALVGIITGEGDPWVWVPAVQALALAGPLAAEVISALVGLITGEGDPSARVPAVHALAGVGPLPREVSSALVGLATGEGDPSARVSAAEALALAGPLAAEVSSALVGLATGEGEPWVRASAARVLAGAGPLAAEVFSALVGVATGEGEPWVRVPAARALALAGPLPREVISALVGLATREDEPWVRASAARALAGVAPLPAEVISALVGLVTGEGDPLVRVSAAQALAGVGPLPAEVISALVGIATGENEPPVRVSAAQALALAGDGPPPAEVISVLIGVAASPVESWQAKTAAISTLGNAEYTETLRGALLAAFRDDDNDVRTEAGDALISLARRHPSARTPIQASLADVCLDPSFGVLDKYRKRPGWDYAYEALRTLTALGPQPSTLDLSAT
jgi:HEAT repeat protein